MSSFIVWDQISGKAIIGSNIVPGNPWEHSSFCAELGGIAGNIMVVKAICDWVSITKEGVTISLDGKEVLQVVKGKWILNVEVLDRDLIYHLQRCTDELLISINWSWIRGHQDKNKSFQKLSNLAKDNVIADEMARLLCKILYDREYASTPVKFRCKRWHLVVQGKK